MSDIQKHVSRVIVITTTGPGGSGGWAASRVILRAPFKSPQRILARIHIPGFVTAAFHGLLPRSGIDDETAPGARRAETSDGRDADGCRHCRGGRRRGRRRLAGRERWRRSVRERRWAVGDGIAFLIGGGRAQRLGQDEFALARGRSAPCRCVGRGLMVLRALEGVAALGTNCDCGGGVWRRLAGEGKWRSARLLRSRK